MRVRLEYDLRENHRLARLRFNYARERLYSLRFEIVAKAFSKFQGGVHSSRSNLINVPMLIPVMGVNSTKAFRRSRPRFQRFRLAIARRHIRYQRLE